MYEKENTFIGISKDNILPKRILIICYMRKHLQTFKEVSFTLDVLLEESGFKSKTKNKSSYIDFRNILQEMIDENLISSNYDILKIKPSEFITVQILDENKLFFVEDNFIKLSIQEYENIISLKNNGVSTSILIGTYLYIKQFIPSDQNLPQISYPKEKTIADGIDSSERTIRRAISVLQDHKIIYLLSDLYVKYEDFYIPCRNVYTLQKSDLVIEKILLSLEKFYGKPVYTKENISGKIIFPNKEA